MKTEEKLNLTMLCDFYELTMGNGYFRAGLQDRITYFDVFFRNVPDNGGIAVCAGGGQVGGGNPKPGPGGGGIALLWGKEPVSGGVFG